MAGIGSIGGVSIGATGIKKVSVAFTAVMNASERRDYFEATGRLMIVKGRIYGKKNQPVISGLSLKEQKIYGRKNTAILKLKI